MSGITNNISKMLSMTTSNMTVYVEEDEKLLEDVRRGWPNRKVEGLSSGDTILADRYLLISDENTFTISF